MTTYGWLIANFSKTVSVLMFASASTLSAASFAQTAPTSIPENSHSKSYGSGWECNLGFRAKDETCFPVIVPDNAHPTNQPWGRGWECLYGFKEVEGLSCIEVVVPKNAFMDADGDRWRCLRQYRAVNEGCQKIALPLHAYLTNENYGSGWLCERGYTDESGKCTAIVVPEHAYLNSKSYGQPWSCERGFVEYNGACAEVTIPDNAYLDDASYGVGWKCERGFSAYKNFCEVIEVPQNAHLNRSGNDWECNRGFWSTNGICALEK